MPANFAALEDRLSAAVDAQFGEPFRFLPMHQPVTNARREQDSSRAVRNITAVFDDRNPGGTSFARLGSTSGGKAQSGGAPQFSASNPNLFVDEREFAAGQMPRHLDRFQRLDTGDVYEIASLDKDGQGRWKYALAKVAKV